MARPQRFRINYRYYHIVCRGHRRDLETTLITIPLKTHRTNPRGFTANLHFSIHSFPMKNLNFYNTIALNHIRKLLNVRKGGGRHNLT
jgi:hypothetical protein